MIQENSFLSTKINPKGQVDSMGKTLSNRSQNDDEFNNSVADWLKQFSDVLSRIENDPDDGKNCSDGMLPNEASQDSHWPRQKNKTGTDSLELINPQTIRPLNAAPVSDISLIDRIAITQGDMDYPVGISDRVTDHYTTRILIRQVVSRFDPGRTPRWHHGSKQNTIHSQSRVTDHYTTRILIRQVA